MWAKIVNNYICVFKKLFSYSDVHPLAEALMTLKNIKRGLIARKYILGEGIEIGGLHRPLPVSSLAKVAYVDMQSTQELRKIYPKFHKKKLVNVSIIDDGEQLATIQDATQDFVIGNHFLEHCQNPFFAIENMLRVLKSRGILYLTIPDKRYSSDCHRPVTIYEHLLKDYQQGANCSRIQHYEEWLRLTLKIEDETEIKKQLLGMLDSKENIHYHVWTNIHYHVWTRRTFQKLLVFLSSLFPFEIELCEQNLTEVISVLRKKAVQKEYI